MLPNGNKPTEMHMTQQTNNIIPGQLRPILSMTVLQPTGHQAGCSNNVTGSLIQHQQPKTNNKSIIIGTWNVRTLCACGKIEETINALKKYT